MKRGRIMILLTVLMLALSLMTEAIPGARAAVGTRWEDDCRGNRTGQDSAGNILYGKHNWVLQSETRGSSCTSTGTGTYHCTGCGARITHETPAPGHKWGEWETTEKATCMERGEEVRVCQVCGQKETRKTNKAPHTWGAWTADPDSGGPGGDLTDPDSGEWKTSEADPCTRQVRETGVCQVCGEIRSRTTGKAAHTWGEWTVILETTDFSTGTRQHICRVCGTEETAAFDPDPTYRRGDSGEGVRKLQEGLNALGYPCGEPDGNFGKKTESAVKAIEKDHGVTVDGVAWPGVQKWLILPFTTYSSGESAHGILSMLRGGPTTYHSDLPFMITQQPEGGILDPDGALTLTVGASGGEKPYTYEWHRYSPLVSTPAIQTVPLFEMQYLKDHIVSTDGPDYTVPGSINTDMYYYCIVRDSETGEETSETVRVGPPLRITVQPQNTSMYGKRSVTLRCGTDLISRNLTYRWFRDGEPVGEPSNEGTIRVRRSGNYECEVSDGTDTVRSDTAAVYNAPEPWVRSMETTAFLCPGKTTAQISVSFQGGVPPLTCEWFREETLLTRYTCDSQEAAEAEWTASDLGTYVFVLTDAVGNTASGTAEVEQEQLKILEQPMGGKVARNGGTYDLRITVGEEAIAPITYTLFRDQESVATQTDDPSFTVSQGGIYSIHVSDSWGRWAESDEVVVLEYDPPVHITGHQKSGLITNSSPKLNGKPGCYLQVQAEGGKKPYRYIWYWEGKKDQEREKNFCFAVKPGKYRCKVIDQNGQYAWTDVIPVKYTAAKPAIIVQPRNTDKNAANAAVLTCKAVSGTGNHAGLRYIWQKWANKQWHKVGNGQKLIAHSAGYYRCVVQDKSTGGSTSSNIARVSPRLIFEHISRKKLSSNQFRLGVWYAGGIGPYKIQIFRREQYQVYSGGQWITKHRSKLITAVTKSSSKTAVRKELDRYYKTVMEGKQVKMKAWYLITITDRTGQKIQRIIEAK